MTRNPDGTVTMAEAELVEWFAVAANAGGLLVQHGHEFEIAKAVHCALVTAAIRDEKFDDAARELLRRAEEGT